MTPEGMQKLEKDLKGARGHRALAIVIEALKRDFIYTQLKIGVPSLVDREALYAESTHSAANDTEKGLRILAYLMENRKQVLKSLC